MPGRKAKHSSSPTPLAPRVPLYAAPSLLLSPSQPGAGGGAQLGDSGAFVSLFLEGQEASAPPAACSRLAGGDESWPQSWEPSSGVQNKQNFFLQLEGEAQS